MTRRHRTDAPAASTVRLGLINDADADAAVDIAAWIRAGGPGPADPPAVLDLYTFTPARRIRQRLG